MWKCGTPWHAGCCISVTSGWAEPRGKGSLLLQIQVSASLSPPPLSMAWLLPSQPWRWTPGTPKQEMLSWPWPKGGADEMAFAPLTPKSQLTCPPFSAQHFLSSYRAVFGSEFTHTSFYSGSEPLSLQGEAREHRMRTTPTTTPSASRDSS